MLLIALQTLFMIRERDLKLLSWKVRRKSNKKKKWQRWRTFRKLVAEARRTNFFEISAKWAPTQTHRRVSRE